MEPWEHLQPIIDRLIPLALDRGLDAITPAERDLFLAWTYPGEVDNGGHASFFYNHAGEFAHETVQALHNVGAPEFAAILSKAIDLFPERHVPRDIEECNEVFNTFSDEAGEMLEQLDQEFYALDKGAELMARLLRFWNAHAG